jgi:hypothetical protein
LPIFRTREDSDLPPDLQEDEANQSKVRMTLGSCWLVERPRVLISLGEKTCARAGKQYD